MFIRHIVANESNLRAACRNGGNLRDRVVTKILATSADDDSGSTRGEFQGGSLANTRRSAGDECDLIRHDRLLWDGDRVITPAVGDGQGIAFVLPGQSVLRA